MRTPATSARSPSRPSAGSAYRCGKARERSRGPPDRRAGAARAGQGAGPRGDRLARDPAADRRPDRDEAGHPRRRDCREPGGRAGARGDRRSRGEQLSLSVQAARAADGADQPRDRPVDRRDDRDQRGLPLGAGPARQPAAPPRHPRPVSRPRAQRARGGQARADRRHLPARGRPPRRRPLRRPRRPQHLCDLGAVRPAPARTVRAPRRPAERGARSVSEEGAAALWCELAWLGGERAEPGVLIELEGERIASVSSGVASAPPSANALMGLTIPGIANAHSHAFQRALRGRTQAERGDFWSWRRRMYEVAATVDPEIYFALARATFAEMALAGFTSVGEFHYLHHDSGGARYEDPNAMGDALLEAARAAGVRITLLDACYLQGGIGREAEGAQLRFSDGSADEWAARVSALESHEGARIGAAVHSVRAVDPDAIAQVPAFASERSWPLHAHVSEQPAEHED